MDNLQKCLDLTLGWMENMGITVDGNKSYTVSFESVKQNRTYYAGKEPTKFTTSMRDLGV